MRRGTGLVELAVASGLAAVVFGFSIGVMAPAGRCAARAGWMDALEGSLALRRNVERDLAAATAVRCEKESLELDRTSTEGKAVTVEYRAEEGRVVRRERAGTEKGTDTTVDVRPVARVFSGRFNVVQLAVRASAVRVELAGAEGAGAGSWSPALRSRLVHVYLPVHATLAPIADPRR